MAIMDAPVAAPPVRSRFVVNASAYARVLEEQALAEREGRCPCMCGKPPAAGSKYYDRGRCRLAAYRARLDAETRDHGLPTSGGSLTLETVRATGSTRSRNGNAEKGTRARPAAKRDGVSTYFPTLQVAEAVRAEVTVPEGAAALDKAIERAHAREARE
jgi:hypothetical protein